MNRSRYSRSNSTSPDKSPQRNLPQHHIVEDRYKSYSKAEDFIKHLNNKYTNHLQTVGKRDEAYVKTFRFKLQQPTLDSKFKVSQFPKAKVNQELLEQQELLNAFNQITFDNKSRCSSRQKTRSLVHNKRSNTAKVNFTYRKEKINFNDKCKDCKKLICDCPKDINDTFLKNFLRKHWKSVEKAGIQNSEKKYRQSFTITQNRFYERPETVIDLKKKQARVKIKKAKKELEMDDSLRISPIHINIRENKGGY